VVKLVGTVLTVCLLSTGSAGADTVAGEGPPVENLAHYLCRKVMENSFQTCWGLCPRAPGQGGAPDTLDTLCAKSCIVGYNLGATYCNMRYPTAVPMWPIPIEIIDEPPPPPA
jgi:hypothetical protein